MPTLTSKAMFLRTEADDWTIYANSTFTTKNPASKVLHRRPSVYARSTDTTSGSPAYVRFNTGSAGAYDPDDYVVWIGYVRHDGDSGSLEYRVRVSANTDLSSAVYDSGSGGTAIDDPWSDRDWSSVMDNPSSGPYSAGQYVGIDVWATSATYIDIGRIMIGQPTQLTRNIRYGAQLPTPIESASRIRGDLGTEYAVDGKKPFQMRGTFLSESAADMRGTWIDFLHRVGTSTPFVFMTDPTETTYDHQSNMYCRFMRIQNLTAPNLNVYGTSFTLKEVA